MGWKCAEHEKVELRRVELRCGTSEVTCRELVVAFVARV